MGNKAKRKLTKISFDFDKAHLAYTSPDNPACSLMDDPILLKALEEGKTLTKQQKAVLESIGYDISEIEKSISDNTKSSTSDDEGSEVDNLNKTKEGNDETMSDQLQKDVANLTKQLAVANAKNELADYKFDKELTSQLAETLAEVEDYSTILKAFDALNDAAKETLDAALEKARKDQEEAVEKALANDENALQKELGREAGEGKTPADEGELTKEQKITKALGGKVTDSDSEA